MQRTDPFTDDWVAALYPMGFTFKQLSKCFQIAAPTVMRIVKSHNIPTRTTGGIYKLPAEDVIRMYKDGYSANQIAKKYSVTGKSIINILEANNVARDNRYHNLSLNVDYWKSIDSIDKAYFLGFSVADANIYENEFRLQLVARDKYILDTFAKYTGNSNPISISDRGEKGIFATFRCKNRTWVEDLAIFGIVPRKSFVVPMPIIDKHLMPHVIRGLIDGNGWISPDGHQIGFCGNEYIVPQVRDFLVDEIGVYPVKILRTQPHLWQICWCGYQDFIAIGNYIFQDKGDCYLRRKYENYHKLITR